MVYTIGSYIRGRRVQLGYTQEQLGKKIGVTNMFISSIETNKSPIPPHRLKKLIKILGLNKNFVMEIMTSAFHVELLSQIRE